MTKAEKMLTEAGFKVTKVYPGARWFEVITPEGWTGAVLRQDFNCWHFFHKGFVGTASDSTVARCHLDGLGDAIGTDTQMRTYKRLLGENNIPRTLVRDNPSVREAIGQVLRD